MRKPFLLLGTCMSLSLSSLLALPAAAQEELPYFRELLQRQHRARQLAPRQKAALSTTNATSSSAARTAAGICDVGTNGDFESQNTPPTYLNNVGGGQGYAGAGATYSPDQLANWYSPTGGSPDYWAENAGPPSTNGPTTVHPGSDMRPSQAVYGPFTPHSPSGAIGLYYNASSNLAAEYVRTPITPLVKGTKYYVEYWVSLSRNVNACTSSINQNFGVVFGMTGTTAGRPYLPLPSDPNVAKVITGIGRNAINNGNASDWQRVSSQIDGNGESTMTFGLFSPSPNGSSSDFNQFTGAANDPKTYVFLDDVALYKIPTAGPAPDCAYGTATIGEGCEIPGATYAWRVQGQTTVFATTLRASVSTSGTYELTVTLPDRSTYTTTTRVIMKTPPPSTAITFTGLVMHNQIFYMQDPKPVYDGSYMCQGSTLSLDISTTGGGSGPATWKVDQMSANEYSLTLSNNGYHAEFVPNVPGYGQPEHPATFEVTLHDACGMAYSRRFTIVSQQGSDPRCPCNDNADAPPCNNGGSGGGGGGGGTTGPIGNEPYDGNIMAYPNPAERTLRLPAKAEQAVLLNSKGQLVKKANSGGVIDVQNLPAGLYNLRTLQNGKVVNQHVEVKH